MHCIGCQAEIMSVMAAFDTRFKCVIPYIIPNQSGHVTLPLCIKPMSLSKIVAYGGGISYKVLVCSLNGVPRTLSFGMGPTEPPVTSGPISNIIVA